MKLNYDKKSKDPTYFIQQGFRNGKKTTTKNIARIGKHSELLQITDDPLAYAREQVKLYNEKAQKENKVTMEVTVDFTEKIKANDDLASSSTHLNIGYMYLQKIYQELKIKDFMKEITADSKLTFDPDLVNSFLTYSRILNPCSKLATHKQLENFYERPDFDYQHIIRTMDLLEKNYDGYITHLFEHSNNIVKRDTSVCYYDCTNYYSECHTEDPDYLDEITGEPITGLRKYGAAKQRRGRPIVEMGLFMDANGIPLSMCIVPGSQNEQTTALPLEEKLTKMLKNKQFIYCADAGLGSENIRRFNDMGGRSFVITQSIKKLSEKFQQAVFSDCDYKRLSSNKKITIDTIKKLDKEELKKPAANKLQEEEKEKNIKLYADKAYKIFPIDKLYDVGLEELYMCKNGSIHKRKSKATLKQNLIVTFSREMFEYQRFVRNNQIARARELLTHIDPEKFKKGPNDVTRFIKRVTKTSNGENVKDRYQLNEEEIAKEEKYDGYYAIVTNLDTTEENVKEILGISANRYKIEDCFRIMKTNFSARPFFHHTRERIIAHFMICFTALLIYRLLERKLDLYGTHFSAANILNTLKNMNVANADDMFYLSTYKGSQVLTSLNAIFGLDLNKKYYLPKELNRKTKKFKSDTSVQQV